MGTSTPQRAHSMKTCHLNHMTERLHHHPSTTACCTAIGYTSRCMPQPIWVLIGQLNFDFIISGAFLGPSKPGWLQTHDVSKNNLKPLDLPASAAYMLG